MCPPTNQQVFANFWLQKSYNFLSPTVQIYLCQTIFCSPRWKWSWKGSTLQMLLRSKKHNCWIKEDPKRGIFGNFSKTLRPWKSLYICQWSIFWIKKEVCVFLMHLQFKKKPVLKHLDRTVYIKLLLGQFLYRLITVAAWLSWSWVWILLQTWMFVSRVSSSLYERLITVSEEPHWMCLSNCVGSRKLKNIATWSWFGL